MDDRENDDREDPPRPSERILAQEILHGADAQQVLDYIYFVTPAERSALFSGQNHGDWDEHHRGLIRAAFGTAVTSSLLLLPASALLIGALRAGVSTRPMWFAVGSLMFVLFGYVAAKCWFEWHTLRVAGLPSAASRVVVGNIETIPRVDDDSIAELRIAGETFPDDLEPGSIEDGVGYAISGSCRVVVERHLHVNGFLVDRGHYLSAIEMGSNAELRRIKTSR